AVCLHRVEEDYDAGLRRELDDVVDSGEIREIRCGKIGGLRERRNSVVGLPVASTTRIALAEQVDPERVEAGCSAIRDERRRLAKTDVADHCLRRVADDQERRVPLIDEVPLVRGDLERMDHYVGSGGPGLTLMC